MFPSQTRDFVFHTLSGDGDAAEEVINPMELLGLDLAASLLERVRKAQPNLSLVLSLCRLLVPCLEYRGNRRHLILEEWSELDLRGDTLFEDTRTLLSRDLAAIQAEDYRVITVGEEPPENSLAEIFWDAHTDLPDLPDVFEDPDMSNFVRVLHDDLVPAGVGREVVHTSEIRRRIMSLWSGDFKEIEVRPPVRQRRRVFKQILAATVRLASQLNGFVAKALVFKRLDAHRRPHDEQTLTPEEESLLELRYGGSPALRDINLGLLFGCGPLFAELVNEFAFAHVAGVPRAELGAKSERMRQYIFLLGKFRQRRKAARAAERRETRLRRADRPRTGRRESAANLADERTDDSNEQAPSNQEWEIIKAILPRLKARDARRLQALIDAHADRGKAAESLGLDRETFNRQWRQTVLKNIQKEIDEVAAGEGFASLLNKGNEDDEKETED